MTDTANAPERIWAWEYKGNSPWGLKKPDLSVVTNGAEYVLSTHCDELVAAAYLDAAQVLEDEIDLARIALPQAVPVLRADIRAIKNRTPDDARAALTAYGERMKADGAKEERKKWQKSVRDTFDAMCAMRDAINEHVPMPSLESDLLHGPENSVFCAAVAESVIESQKKAQAKIARLTEALNEKQDDGKNFWMKWTQKRLEINRAMFLRDAKLALAGDMRALRNRVELMEAEPVPLVLSSALQENADE